MISVEKMYCLSCMVKWIGDKHGDCPECKRNNFFLLRGGDIGTTVTFQDLKITSKDFEDLGEIG